ncbi:hypothetical protein L1049_020980 [Liquidambar formosana]|uniref:Cullin N-terminal domain-containing protein n=1 Tax=Liquidambar formosana TaxID=63359 RepID=A0AAP0SDG8_LIQFO
MKKVIMFDEGFNIMEEGITKAKNILSGYPIKTLFTSEEFMKYYNCVYCMCSQRPPHEYSKQLYERYKRALEESIVSMVLPSLMDKHDAPLLIELKQMWGNYKAMAKCLSGFFLYLDRHFISTYKLASLNDVSVHCFRDLVCNKLYGNFCDAALSLINQERNGKQIDCDLLKNLLTFFVEIGEHENKYYEYFEQVMLADTADYYSRLSSEQLSHDSSADYILKVDWCLNQEKIRASQYLCWTTLEKLLQVVRWQLMNQTASKLIEKQKSESHDPAICQQELVDGEMLVYVIIHQATISSKYAVNLSSDDWSCCLNMPA